MENVRGNSQAESDAVRICMDWYDDDKAARQFYVDEMREMYKLYTSRHWDLLGPNGNPLRTEAQQQNRPNSVENITFSLIEGTVAEFANEIELIDQGVEPGDEEKSNIMTDLKKFLFYKNKLTSERIKFLRWFFLYGTGIWHIYWDSNWRGGKGPNRWEGDIRWKALHPLCLVPDARCREDINEGNRCHKPVWRTMEYIQENFPDRAKLVQEQGLHDDDLLDTDQLDTEGFSRSYNQEQVPVIETWYIGKPMILAPGEQDQGIGLHVILWAGEHQGVYLRHSNYMYFDPGETPVFPFFVRQRYPRENSVWGFGDAFYLKNPQIVRNKTAEIILEGHIHGAIGQTWYDERSLTPRQKRLIEERGTAPGMWFPVADIQGVKREHGQPIPGSLIQEMGRLQSSMEGMIGRFDVSQGRTPGSVTAFKAIAELVSQAKIRLRTAEQEINSSYEDAGQFTNRLIGKFYTEQRTYRINGKNDKEGYKYNTFNADEMKKVYDKENGITMPFNEVGKLNTGETIMPDGRMLDANTYQKDFEEYFPDFDCYCKVSSVIPSDRMYHMEIAKDLLVASVIDPETFFYVMEYGKFPPIPEIMERMNKQKEEQQRMEMEQEAMKRSSVPGEQPPEQEEVSQQGNEIEQILSQLPPEIREYLMSLPPEQMMSELQLLIQQDV